MGSGTSNNVWSQGNDGVRVTVVRAKDRTIVTIPIDITNKPPDASIYNFGKISKIQYGNGKALFPQKGGYNCIKPPKEMPRIVSTNGSNNIEAIKKYFCSEYTVQMIANHTGINYDMLIGGEYKLMLEPIAYYKFEGVMIATTATEAAMYDEKVSGLLRKRMVSLSHKNLPLAMFLEVSDLGYPAWKGSTTKAASNADIKSSLGLGVVRFTEQTEPPVVSTDDYEYRVNTEVITSVMISGGQSDPDNPTRISFHINGKTYNVGNIYYPEGDSQLAWVKWTTPDTEQNMNIDVAVKGPGGTDKTTIHCRIVDLDKNPPPNPVADDRNDDFTLSPIPQRAEKTRAEWNVWDPWWHEYWVWHSTGENSGYWCDHGWWEFNLNKYYAVFSADMKLLCDGKNPTANARTMKSGYGVNQQVSASVSSNQFSAVTNPQNAVSYFPEFNYNTYWRLLEQVRNGSNSRFEFQKNKYSTYKNRTHFTPIWMPNGKYEVNTWVIDSWTPVGMMSKNLSDSLLIHGSLWDDWHVAPLKP
ncbi:MAG: hypothetical protein VB095_00690 [Anaerovorax sp.]|nr:hypothetical protein [Anaerovorax sp.]